MAQVLPQKRLGIVLFFIFLSCFSCLFRNSEITLPDSVATTTLYSSDTHQNLQQIVLQAINRANQSIVVIIYSLQDPVIISALKNKAAQGVHVTVLYDPVASIDAAWHLGEKIKALPVRSSRGLMHLKLISIDKKEAWIGSCNLSTDSLLLHGNLLFGFSSETMAQLIELRALQLQKIEPQQALPYCIQGKKQDYQIFFSPQQGKLALDKIEALIQSAQKTIKVASYTFTNDRICQNLIDAHKRGVQVQVIFDRDSAAHTSLKTIQKLQRAHVTTSVRKIQGLMHHKFAVIDDTTLIMGSANWTKAAFTINDEITCVVHPLTPTQQDIMKKTWDAMVESSTLPSK